MNEVKSIWQIMVPTISNSGKPFRTRYHRVWDSKVRGITGGLTVNLPVKGQWVDDSDTLYSERMIPVTIMATEDEIERIAEMTMVYYDQHAVMYYKISDHAVIKHRNK